MNIKTEIRAAFMTALVLSASASAGEPIFPSLNFAPGDNFTCRMEMNKKVRQTIAGDEQMMEQIIEMAWDYDVIARDEKGNYQISARPIRIKSRQKFGMQVIEFDSDNPGEYTDPSMAGFKAMIGSELRMTVEPTGKVLELEGFEGIIDKVIEDLKIPDSPQRDQIMKGLQNQFGDEAMRSSFEQITSFYPVKPVKIGDTWHSELTLDVGFPMVIESDYTLVSSDSGIANINVVSAISSNPNSGGIDMGAFSLIYDIKGDQNGSIKLDEQTGLLLRSDMRQEFSGTVSVSEAPDLQERNWPISADGSMIISFERR
jgi:hypothetical protein